MDECCTPRGRLCGLSELLVPLGLKRGEAMIILVENSLDLKQNAYGLSSHYFFSSTRFMESLI